MLPTWDCDHGGISFDLSKCYQRRVLCNRFTSDRKHSSYICTTYGSDECWINKQNVLFTKEKRPEETPSLVDVFRTREQQLTYRFMSQFIPLYTMRVTCSLWRTSMFGVHVLCELRLVYVLVRLASVFCCFHFWIFHGTEDGPSETLYPRFQRFNPPTAIGYNEISSWNPKHECKCNFNFGHCHSNLTVIRLGWNFVKNSGRKYKNKAATEPAVEMTAIGLSRLVYCSNCEYSLFSSHSSERNAFRVGRAGAGERHILRIKWLSVVIALSCCSLQTIAVRNATEHQQRNMDA